MIIVQSEEVRRNASWHGCALIGVRFDAYGTQVEGTTTYGNGKRDENAAPDDGIDLLPFPGKRLVALEGLRVSGGNLLFKIVLALSGCNRHFS